MKRWFLILGLGLVLVPCQARAQYPSSCPGGSATLVWSSTGAQFICSAQLFDVKAFGAKGTDAVDDGTAIAAAISASQNALTGSGNVYLPPGTYRVTSTITVPAGVHVYQAIGAEVHCVGLASGSACIDLAGNSAKWIGGGDGDGTLDNGRDPSISFVPTDAASILCTSCSSTSDGVRVSIPRADRTNLASSIISSGQVSGLYINMGGTGRDAVYTTSPHWSKFENLAGYNFAGNGFHLEGDLASPNNSGAAYHNRIDNIIMQAPHSNTSGAGCYLDAANGEISWNYFGTMRCSGNITNGGGNVGLLLKAGESGHDSLNQNNITVLYAGNTIDQLGSYGVELLAPGDWSAQTGGRISDTVFSSVLIEKIFSGTQGTCIGGQTGSGAGGTGIGGVVFSALTCSSHWGTTIDSANLGQHVTMGGSTNSGGGQPNIAIKGTVYGGNSAPLAINTSNIATASRQRMYGLNINPTFDDNGHSSVRHFIAAFTTGSAVRGEVFFGYQNHLTQSGNGVAGTCTFSSSTTCSVNFGYNFHFNPVVIITPINPGSETYKITSLSTSGFTVTASASVSTTVDYVIIGNPY